MVMLVASTQVEARNAMTVVVGYSIETPRSRDKIKTMMEIAKHNGKEVRLFEYPNTNIKDIIESCKTSDTLVLLCHGDHKTAMIFINREPTTPEEIRRDLRLVKSSTLIIQSICGSTGVGAGECQEMICKSKIGDKHVPTKLQKDRIERFISAFSNSNIKTYIATNSSNINHRDLVTDRQSGYKYKFNGNDVTIYNNMVECNMAGE